VKPPRQTRGLIPIGETSHETSKRSYQNGWSQRSKSRTSRFTNIEILLYRKCM